MIELKLADLYPEWLTPDMFIFRNPTGGDAWLTCKRVTMTTIEQQRAIYGDFMDERTKTKFAGQSVVLTAPECVWAFKGSNFTTLTVNPSINASKSGNWHGFIVNGEIV